MKKLAVSAAVFTALLFGCAARQEEALSTPPQYGPPMPLTDQIAPCPGPEDQWTWQGGHYIWTGNRYTWQSGSWVIRPAPEARWKQPTWVPRTYGWTFMPGYWY